jgi:hypothetical protein
MKTITKIFAACSKIFAFVALTSASAKSATPILAAPPTETKMETDQATVLTGKVRSVDAKAGKLTIKTNDREVKLTADSKTTRAALEKLKVGDTARVFEKGGKVIAASPVKADSKTKATK